MPNDEKYITEWNQVYLNGAFPFERGPSDNLRDLTQQFNNGARTPQQIYSILRGMGIDKNKALCAVHEYVIKPNSVKEEKKNTKMNSEFNLSILEEKLSTLKEKLEVFKKEDASRINFTTDQALRIIEKYLGEFNVVHGMEKKLEEIRKKIRIEETIAKDLDKELVDLRKKEAEALKNENKDSAHSISNKISEMEEEIEKRDVLNDLQKEAETVESNIVETSNRKKFEIARNSLRDLRIHDWLVPVSNYVSEVDVIFQNHVYSFKVNEMHLAFQIHKYSEMYKFATGDLKSMIDHSEDRIRDNMVSVLEKHKWIPEIKSLLLEKARNDAEFLASREGKVVKVYSPVQMNEDGSFTFSLGGKYYVLAECKISEAEGDRLPDGEFVNAERAMKNFKISDNKFTLYEGDRILEFDPSENKMQIDGKDFDFSNLDNFRKYMKSTGFYGMNKFQKIDEICQFLESYKLIKELDFVTSIVSTRNAGVFVNIISTSLTENIYVNKINPAMGSNTMEETDSAVEAQEYVNELIDIDISNLVYDKLEEEAKTKADLENKKDEILGKLDDIEGKKKEVAEAITKYGETDELKSALKLVDEEVKKLEINLQETYNEIAGKKNLNERKKKSLEDRGFVMGKLKNNTGDFKKDDVVWIDAEAYSSGGGNDYIKVISKDEKTKDAIRKRYLKAD